MKMRLYLPTAITLHRINEAHDLRPHLRRWTGANDNGGAVNVARS